MDGAASLRCSPGRRPSSTAPSAPAATRRAFLATGASVIAFDRDPPPRRFAEGLPADRFRLVAGAASPRWTTWPARARSTAWRSTSASPPCSWTRPSAASPSCATARSTCAWAPRGPTAADLVNDAEQAELARILFVYGEERQSRRIAAAIARRRAEQPFTRTLELAEFIEKALGGRRGAKVHPATRSFQAIRIAVNEELSELEAGLLAAERALKAGGRLCVVTFHSLEDRIVKTFLAVRAGRTPAGSRHAPPVADAARAPSFQLLFNGARGAVGRGARSQPPGPFGEA